MGKSITIQIEPRKLEQLMDLPTPADLHGIDEIFVKFGRDIILNSVAIRSWIRWSSEISQGTLGKITLQECSMAVIHQVNLIANFLPERAIIQSFYVRFANDATGEEKMVLLKRGVHFDENRLNLPEVFDGQGAKMEADVIKDRFFRFLKK